MSTPTVNVLSPAAVSELVSAGKAVVLDVRTPLEYSGDRIPAALNMPLDQFDAAQAKNSHPDKIIILSCQAGTRARTAAGQVGVESMESFRVLDGGFVGWETAGLPVTKGKKVIGLERQVRIGAGMITLIGALLAIFVHPNWVGVCAFVGAGLTFAGITDICMMGTILGKMPWNRASGAAASPCVGGTCSIENNKSATNSDGVQS